MLQDAQIHEILPTSTPLSQHLVLYFNIYMSVGPSLVLPSRFRLVRLPRSAVASLVTANTGTQEL